MQVTIASWLDSAERCLKEAGVPSARLDAEVLLAHTLKKPRTYLHAHHDDTIDDLRALEIADARLDLRKDRTPVAYIIGHKDFYGRRFHVTPATLIPRPESEDGITLLNELIPATTPLLDLNERLVDIGTGSGVLGITAKLEHPELDVHLVDISRHALNVARRNARQLHADATLHESNLLKNFPLKVRYIVANLPYVDRTWDDISPELRHEPEQALFADESGLALIYQLIEQTHLNLEEGGHLLIEADPTQHPNIIRRAKENSLHLVTTRGYYIVFRQEA